MSQRQVSLSSPPLIAGVVVVLAVLVVVNVRTFAPKGSQSRGAAEVRVQAHPSLPLDLEDVLRPSSAAPGVLGASLTGPRPDVARDPFTATAINRSTAAAQASNRPVTRRGPAGAPACAAVMLGSGTPAALVDGRLCRVGDRVGKFVIERIDARGVTLGGAHELFLPVGVSSSGDGVNKLVTGAMSGDQAGRTSLVEYAESERN